LEIRNLKFDVAPALGLYLFNLATQILLFLAGSQPPRVEPDNSPYLRANLLYIAETTGIVIFLIVSSRSTRKGTAPSAMQR